MIPILLLFGLSFVAALPTSIFIPRTPSPRFQHIQDGLGRLHLMDLWQLPDFSARYNPDRQNVYHLFTRKNPTVSQPIVFGNAALLQASNFDRNRRTAVLIHGWLDNATGTFNSVVLAAFLAAADVNVIVVDWSAGSSSFNAGTLIQNTILSGQGVARFISWVNGVTGANLADYHIAGYSLGGQQSGVVGRSLGGRVGYITGLDPAGLVAVDHKFRPSDAVYTEVIHTNIGGSGYTEPLADVDFYPNGGAQMPGCTTNGCSHDRCFYYFAESIRSGGFTGVKCETWRHAAEGNCNLPETLQMGGLAPKTGRTGVFYLQTNAGSPFSRG